LNGRLVTLAALTALVVIMLAGLYVATQTKVNTSVTENRDILYQVASFNAFSTGQFEGTTRFSELAKHGDFGIGTLNDLDGEMIVLNGTFYQVPVDGKPVLVNQNALTPYATVTFFDADITLNVNNMTYSELTSYINESLPDDEAIYAIKVSGIFDYVKTRSVPAQTQPYPPLSEAVNHQAVFELANVTGTAVGFYFPNSMSGVDFAGYHLHFLTDDFTAGGHMLESVIRNAKVQIDYTNKYSLILP
jgi:acetolactate decarboxylase